MMNHRILLQEGKKEESSGKEVKYEKHQVETKQYIVSLEGLSARKAFANSYLIECYLIFMFRAYL